MRHILGLKVSLIGLQIAASRGVALILELLAMVALVRARHRLRGTTLVGPASWAIVSLSSLLAVVGADACWELGSWELGNREHWHYEHWHYLAAVTTLAPFVALLGAKRPQNRAWQFIVAALVALLWLQSIRALLIDPSLPPLPHAAWRWLIAVILAAEFANYLPTRNAPAALLIFAGQICLLSGQLPMVPPVLQPAPTIGLALLATGVLLATALAGAPRRPCSPTDQAWLKFRDAFGAVWALRIAERVNAVAKAQSWPIRLGWHGFHLAEGRVGQAIDGPTQAAAEQTLAGLLWRFIADKRPNTCG